jgi:hypothetical protein
VLELRREMGVLRPRKFDAETRLQILTVTTQVDVDIMASPPALLVDQLRALPDRVRGRCVSGCAKGHQRLWTWPMHSRTSRGSPSFRQGGPRATTRSVVASTLWSSPQLLTPSPMGSMSTRSFAVAVLAEPAVCRHHRSNPPMYIMAVSAMLDPLLL